MSDFAAHLLRWYDRHGRHDLPWQEARTPYRVWLSEIMLQQTQVQTVVPYFQRFVAALPELDALAEAPLDEVLALWSGLGYYSRARNLHRCARLCMERHAGELPRDFERLIALPGIGRSTAGAILAQAHDLPYPILDGNVRRVLCRFHGIEQWPGSAEAQRLLWQHAQAHLPQARLADYTQAQMDLGATVCTRGKPRCDECPLHAGCAARIAARTTELPLRRPGKAIPQRATHMLLVQDGAGQLLLVRRPPTGVWASLWSLPEVDTPAQAEAWLGRFGAAATAPAVPGPPLLHTFSHFRLHITPLHFRDVQAHARACDNPDLQWLPLSQLPRVGLPAPVRRLIESIDA